MAFRTTGISPRDIFLTRASVNEGLAHGLEKLGAGIGGFIEKKRELDEKAKKEQDAIDIFRAAKQGDINSIFNEIDDDDNAQLALNLANVLTTKNQIDAQAEKAKAEAAYKNRLRQNEEEFYGDNGADLLSVIQEKLPGLPGVTVERQVPVMVDGKVARDEKGNVIYETKLVQVAPPVMGDPNPLHAIKERILKSGKRLTPEFIKQILSENEQLQRAAAAKAREYGLNARAAARIQGQGQTEVGRLARDAQGHEYDKRLEGVKQEDRVDLEQLRQGNRLGVVSAQSIARIAEIDKRLSGARTADERNAVLRKELQANELKLRQDLAEAKAGETKERLLAINDRILTRFIHKLQESQLDLGEEIEGKKPEVAYWMALGPLSAEGIENYAIRNLDANAIYVYIAKMIRDRSLAEGIGDGQVDSILKTLREEGVEYPRGSGKKHRINVTMQGLDKFLKVLEQKAPDWRDPKGN